MVSDRPAQWLNNASWESARVSHRLDGLPALAAVVALLAGGATALAQPYDYLGGHGDIGLAYDASAQAARLYLKFGITGEVAGLTPQQLVAGKPGGVPGEWPVEDFVAVVPVGQRFAREPGAEWSFIGVAADEPYWELPEFSTAGVPYLGFSTELLSGIGPARFVLRSVLAGPTGGQVSLWQNGPFGEPLLAPDSYWSTFEQVDRLAIPIGTHRHFAFGFTEPGSYALEVVGTAPSFPGEAVGVLRFRVEGDAPAPVVISVPAGDVRTQAQAGYPVIAGEGGVTKTGPGTLVLDATNTFTGPLTVAEGTVRLSDPSALSHAAPTVAAGALLEIDPALGAANAVSLAGLGPIHGRIDVGTGRFMLAPADEPLDATLRTLLISGRAGGSWEGSNGILSSDAPTFGNAGGFAVGYRISADRSATVAWASLGDADLDGAVTTADVNAILTSGRLNNGLGGASWQQGDFDYDGFVTTADINALLTTGRLNTGSYLPILPVAGALHGQTMPDHGSGLPWGGSLHTVPEPAGFGPAGLPVGAALVAAAAAGRRKPDLMRAG
jgi:autotransporter-associated beta strand protein